MQKFYYYLRPILAGLLIALLTFPSTAQILSGTLAAGSAHSVVVQPDGSLRAWGSNSDGQIGNGGGPQVLAPTAVGTSTTYTQVAAGVNHTLAIRADGTLWAWGDNYFGGLGDGTTISRTTPVQVGNATTWKQVAVGNYYSLALRADGTLWAWGNNTYGELGDGTFTRRLLPGQVGAGNTWLSVAAGSGYPAAVRADGTLWAWGGNNNGRTPTRVGSASNWLSVAAGGSHRLALRTDGTLWAWGNNIYGQLGTGNYADQPLPVQIGSTRQWRSISAGYLHSAAIAADGSLWAWGYNSAGGVGDGTTINRNSPVPVGSATSWVSVSQGNGYTLAMQADGTLWAWGANAAGQLADGTTTNRLLPAQVADAAGLPTRSLAAGTTYSAGIDPQGRLLAWGANSFGQLGDGTTVLRRTPTRVGTASTWVQVAAGSAHTLAVRADGTLWSWGYNFYGQLGDGTMVSQRATPAQIGNDRLWRQAWVGDEFSLALAADGTLWAWGHGLNNVLGSSKTGSQRTPLLVNAGTTWRTATTGDYHVLAVAAGGALWSWGANIAGQLGQGSQAVQSTPAQVGTATNWLAIAGGDRHSLALTADGVLWSWGQNPQGQLGDGTLASHYTPAQVSNTGLFTQITAGANTGVALRPNGTLWSWGANDKGQLGDNTTTQRSTPVPEATSGTRWLAIASGESHSLARTTNASNVYSTGDNNYGKLGDGTSNNALRYDHATVALAVTGPTATINSSAGPSTSFAPIPVSVVFSTAVTDFDATDVSIGGATGTLVANSFRGSGTTYSFTIQPQDAPLVNVTLSIEAGAVHDAGGSANPAATFSIQYVRPTATTRQGNNNDWFNPTSWDYGVPTRNIDAIVPSGLVAYLGSGNAQARSLLVGAGANVLQVGGTMELTGNLISQGSTNSGTYLRELLLTGPSNQTIANGQALNLSKLTVGSSGATLNGPLTVSTLLTLKGDLTTNNQTLRLITNYAASGANPALVDNAGGVVQGAAIVERAINSSNQGLGYRHYSSPVADATVATLTTANFTPEVSQASVYNTSATPGATVPFPTVYAYDESRLASVTNTYSAFDKGFVVPSSLNAPLVLGQGYAVNIAGTEVVSFVGTLNNGDYPVALTRVAGNPDAGWALVGNPYPAVLDWDLTTRTGLNDAFYMVQSTGQYIGGYSGYVNGLAVNNGSQFVAPGQGFFVRVADGQTSGSITFTNAARTVTAAPTAFQRPGAEVRPLVRLALTGAGLTDEVVAYAETGATSAFDHHFDAAKLANPTGLNLSSLSAGASLAIDGRAAFTPATTLPLGVGVPAAGAYTLTAAALDNLPSGLTAYLRDAQTGQTTKLTAGISYNFRVSADEAHALILGRFTVVFSPPTALATAPSLSVEAVSVYPNPAHGTFTVTMPSVTGASAVQVELVNTLGQVVRRQSAALAASGTSFSVSTAELAAGVYVLHLQAGDTTLTKRVVVR